MNLKAFFNLNYFKENIRKSKGLLAFFLGVIPIINIIFLIIVLTMSDNNLLTFNLVSIFTYLGLLFIPVALSLTLFGFVFKKKSVDFVMSKPISRKSIFLTNTIGGIFIIFIFMLINTLIFGLFSLLFTNLTIPFALLLDYFIFWLVSYIFMFIVSNLAVVLSGNFITSIIVLLILALIIPFINGINHLTRDYYSADNYIVCESEDCKPDNYLCYGDTSCEEHLLKNEYQLYYASYFNYHFISPLQAGNNDTFYDTISIIKMLALSIVYMIAGFFVFKHRKMENNETSFKNHFAHFLIKGITLLPVCLLTYAILTEAGGIGWLISIVIIIIYSIVYDLITRKEIYKFLKSTIYSLILFLIFTGAYYLNFEVFNSSEKVINHVDSITYEGMEIKDEALKNTIIKSLLSKNTENFSFSYNFTFKEGNNIYSVTADVNPSLEEILNEELAKWNEEQIKNFNFDQVSYMEYNYTMIPVKKEITNMIKENIDKIDDFDLANLSSDEKLSIYRYQNHNYESIFIPVKLTEELYQEILTYQNELFIKHKEKTEYDSYYNLSSYDSQAFTDEDFYVFDYVIKSNEEAFLDYLKNDNEIDINKQSMYIRVFDLKDYTITIGDEEAFKIEFDSYKEKISNNPEYIRLIEEYHNMQENGVYY